MMIVPKRICETRSDDISLIQRTLVTVVGRLDRRSGANPNLGEPLRSRLIEELEKCLVSEERLVPYMETLDAVLKDRNPYAGSLTDVRLDSIRDNGLAVLSDGELLRFALDPIDLWTFHVYYVNDDISTYWNAVQSMGDSHKHNTTDPTGVAVGAPPPGETMAGATPDDRPSTIVRFPQLDTDVLSQPGMLPEDAPSIQRSTSADSRQFSRQDAPTGRLSALTNRPPADQDQQPQSAKERWPTLVLYGFFVWHDQRWMLQIEDECSVYVSAPPGATHLKIGDNENRLLCPLGPSQFEGLSLVTGITYHPLWRRIEGNGESLSFVFNTTVESE
jgi:hypothetical protein